jgi:hypothetical protein
LKIAIDSVETIAATEARQGFILRIRALLQTDCEAHDNHASLSRVLEARREMIASVRQSPQV